MIISGEYFNVDLLLKDAESSIPNAEALGVGSQLNNAIKKYEPEILNTKNLCLNLRTM